MTFSGRSLGVPNNLKMYQYRPWFKVRFSGSLRSLGMVFIYGNDESSFRARSAAMSHIAYQRSSAFLDTTDDY